MSPISGKVTVAGERVRSLYITRTSPTKNGEMPMTSADWSRTAQEEVRKASLGGCPFLIYLCWVGCYRTRVGGPPVEPRTISWAGRRTPFSAASSPRRRATNSRPASSPFWA
jgi:hypothetical protein